MINIEKVAKVIRDALPAANGEVYAEHIRRHPWETLPDQRKVKYRVLAEAAINEVLEQQELEGR